MSAKKLLTFLTVVGLGMVLPEAVAQTRTRIQIGDEDGAIIPGDYGPDPLWFTVGSFAQTSMGSYGLLLGGGADTSPPRGPGPVFVTVHMTPQATHELVRLAVEYAEISDPVMIEFLEYSESASAWIARVEVELTGALLWSIKTLYSEEEAQPDPWGAYDPYHELCFVYSTIVFTYYDEDGVEVSTHRIDWIPRTETLPAIVATVREDNNGIAVELAKTVELTKVGVEVRTLGGELVASLSPDSEGLVRWHPADTETHDAPGGVYFIEVTVPGFASQTTVIALN